VEHTPAHFREAKLAQWLFGGSLVVLGILLLFALGDLLGPPAANERWIPIVRVVCIVLATIALALMFSRVFVILGRIKQSKYDMGTKGSELVQEARTTHFIEKPLKRVMGSATSAVMTLRSVRDAGGKIVDFEYLIANEEAERMTGLGHGELVGKRLKAVMPGSVSDGSLDEYIKVVDSGVPYTAERHMGNNGVDHWMGTHVVRLYDGFAVTFTDITERLRAHELDLESARLSLADRIARTVAHEVRNPLTNVHLGLEQLTDELVTDREVAQPYLDIINRNVKRIGQLVTEMLGSSRRREVNAEPCTVKDLVENAMKRVADRLELHNMKGEVDVADGIPTVLVDPELIDLAITNIAVNAVEAMEPGKGVLHMSARSTGDGVVIELRDNGKGIQQENIPRLFEAFYSERTGGLGLGLTTARSILNAHGILLQVASVVGQGTTFTLLFPKAPVA